MAFEIIGSVDTWKAAFDRAGQLLDDKKLTAVAVVNEEAYERGGYIATQLQEGAAMAGSMHGALALLEQASPLLYEEARSFRLAHGQFTSHHPYSEGNDWMLAIIYS